MTEKWKTQIKKIVVKSQEWPMIGHFPGGGYIDLTVPNFENFTVRTEFQWIPKQRNRYLFFTIQKVLVDKGKRGKGIFKAFLPKLEEEIKEYDDLGIQGIMFSDCFTPSKLTKYRGLIPTLKSVGYHYQLKELDNDTKILDKEEKIFKEYPWISMYKLFLKFS